ncbi:MAG TPA: glyoxalase [Marmoricola sp.]|nr:glyoxalase [Marmoricola sp.]
MSVLDTVTLETSDTATAEAFWKALGVEHVVSVHQGDTPSDGFRGYTLSLVASQPGNADALLEIALAAGATVLKPARKTFWGYGGVVQAPDGAILKVASSAKKDTAPAAASYDTIALLLGVADVKATRQFYVDRGLSVAKSFGSKYVELDTDGAPITLALYGRKALAKDAGVDPQGSGGHRITLNGDLGTFTDPDGFIWA